MGCGLAKETEPPSAHLSAVNQGSSQSYLLCEVVRIVRGERSQMLKWSEQTLI